VRGFSKEGTSPVEFRGKGQESRYHREYGSDSHVGAQGNSIAFQDLLIRATALFLGFDVATLNVRHFQAIPTLKVVML
jgi:predicted nucleic acid-binding protein